MRTPITVKRSADDEWRSRAESGASKRARYWLGDRAAQDVTSSWDEDDDDDDDAIVVKKQAGDPVEEPQLVHDCDEPQRVLNTDPSASPHRVRSWSKSAMRGISEDIAESMEV